jgi:hypothetical protein
MEHYGTSTDLSHLPIGGGNAGYGTGNYLTPTVPEFTLHRRCMAKILEFKRKEEKEYICPRCAEIQAREAYNDELVESDREASVTELMQFAINGELIIHLQNAHGCECDEEYWDDECDC